MLAKYLIRDNELNVKGMGSAGGGNGFRLYPDGSMIPKMFVGGMLYA